jgi:hypothetical protein
LEFTTVGLTVAALMSGLLYLQRRRARMARED